MLYPRKSRSTGRSLAPLPLTLWESRPGAALPTASGVGVRLAVFSITRETAMNPTQQPANTRTASQQVDSGARRDSLTITDNRTGKTYEVPITDETIRALDLRKVKINEEDFGIISYDPAFNNTASCKSRITFIDGDKGILRYRGYPIEQLAEQSSFLEVAYLLYFGELPSRGQLGEFVNIVMSHTLIHEQTKKFIDGFRHDARPMGMFLSTVAALSTFYQEGKNIFDAQNRLVQFERMTAKMPTIAAFCYRHSIGMPFSYPDGDLTYAGNF